MPPSPYRSETDALRERKITLEREIEALRAQTLSLEDLKARQDALTRELSGIDGRLRDGGSQKRSLPLLDQVRVASPCNESWNGMVGDDRVRFCHSCEKNVFNLSAMSSEDAEALLQQHLGGDLCVRFYQRADGTILTQDCPQGLKKKRRRKLALAVAGAGAMAAAAAAAVYRQAACSHTQGAVAVPSEPAIPSEAIIGALPDVRLEAVKGGVMMGTPAVPAPPPLPRPTTGRRVAK